MSKRRKFTTYEKEMVYNTYGGRCALCGRPVGRGKMTIAHRVPLSKGGTNAPDNLMLACWECSHMKNNMSMDVFLQRVREIGEYAEK